MSKQRPDLTVLKRAVEPSTPAAQAAPQRYVPPAREGKKSVGFYVSEEAWRMLREMAMDERTNVQALGVEALNMLFADRKKPRIAE
jgi:hypothetical protein